MAEEKKMPMGFGITHDTKDSNTIKMLPPIKCEPTARFPEGYKFSIGKLVNIVAKENYETKNGETEVLQFVFRDKDGRQYIHTEWKQDPSDEKYLTKMEALNIRINHIYKQMYDTVPAGGIGTKATSFFEYFTEIVKAFKVNPDIHKMSFYLKLVYYNNNLGFPYAPNFLERVVKDMPCTLEVNLKYDHVEQSAPMTSKMPGIPSGTGDNIDFEAEYE